MASDTQRGFYNPNGVGQTQIGMALVNFLQTTKKLNVEYEEDENGFYVVADNKKVAGIQKLAGAVAQIGVAIVVDETGYVGVIVGEKKIAGKAAVGLIGLAVMPVLAAPAAYGATKQKLLEKDIFEFLESYIPSAMPDPRFQNVQIEVPTGNESGADVSTIVCSVCGSESAAGTKFCGQCGSELSQQLVCTACGSPLVEGSRFCTSCGARVPTKNVCPICDAELQEDQRFCHECGFDTLAE